MSERLVIALCERCTTEEISLANKAAEGTSNPIIAWDLFCELAEQAGYGKGKYSPNIYEKVSFTWA